VGENMKLQPLLQEAFEQRLLLLATPIRILQMEPNQFTFTIMRLKRYLGRLLNTPFHAAQVIYRQVAALSLYIL
jgi:hypothetical protein